MDYYVMVECENCGEEIHQGVNRTYLRSVLEKLIEKIDERLAHDS